MQKKFITNLAIVLFLNLLIKPIWIFGIDRVVQNVIDPASYGEYFVLFNFSFLLNIILDFGITNFNNTNIAQNNHLLTKHFSSLVTLKLALAVVYILATLICGFLNGYDARLTKLLLVLGFNQFLLTFTLYLRSNLAGLHLFKTDSVISVLDRLLMIIICGSLLWGSATDRKMDIMTFVYTQTSAYFLTALITFIIVLTKTHTFKLKWNWPFSIMILKKSIPYAILVLLMTFFNRIDSVMLFRILPSTPEASQNGVSGAVQASIYAQSYRLLDAVNMFAFLFSGLLLPIFSRMLKFRDSVEPLVKLAFTLLITPAVVLGVGCCFYSKEVIEMLYIKHLGQSAIVYSQFLDQSAAVFSLLMWCFMCQSMSYIFGTLLTANRNLKDLNILAGSCMVINITLNIILIPHLLAFGSAIAALVTQFTMAIAQIIFVQRKFKFRVNYRLLVTLFVFTIGVVAINYFSKNFYFDNKKWFLNFGIMVIISILWAFFTRLISIKSMFRVLKYG
ncbi:MAG: oligosaccharide flippase family protein [Bacteroidia bacterium]|nr:oligosaccharide flippase family protein [Bacteroidia bacterium]